MQTRGRSPLDWSTPLVARPRAATAPLFSRVGPFDFTYLILPLPRRRRRRSATRKIRGRGLKPRDAVACVGQRSTQTHAKQWVARPGRGRPPPSPVAVADIGMLPLASFKVGLSEILVGKYSLDGTFFGSLDSTIFTFFFGIISVCNADIPTDTRFL